MSDNMPANLAAAAAVTVALAGCATTSSTQRASSTGATTDPVAEVEAIRGYSFGQSREPLSVVEDLVREAARGEGEAEALTAMLVAVAIDPATSRDVRNFACRQLALIAGPSEAKRLAPLLLDPETTDDARYAIHPIPGKRVDQVLTEALEKATDNAVRAGLINTLAARRVQTARAEIAKHSSSDDPVLAEVSKSALEALAG
jgi:hypothetical protein